MSDPSLDELFRQAVELSGPKLAEFLSAVPASLREELKSLLDADASAANRGLLDKIEVESAVGEMFGSPTSSSTSDQGADRNLLFGILEWRWCPV